MAQVKSVITSHDGPVRIVTLHRPFARNAVDRATAAALADAVRAFEADDEARVMVLDGEGDFCAGADLKAFADHQGNDLTLEGDGPMGPTRLHTTKPTIAAIEGYAVAGGLELALWCDLRVAGESATFGVFCRRFGVPLIDGGTVRLPRLIGLGRALDLILTGRAVSASEALAIGLAQRVVPTGTAREAAKALAHQLAALPQTALRADLVSARHAFDLPEDDAILAEFSRGIAAIEDGSAREGAAAFTRGEGRNGRSR